MKKVDMHRQGKIFLTKREAARLLGASVRSLDYWRESKNLGCIRIGSFIRFETEQLLLWVREHREIKDQDFNSQEGERK